MNCLTIVGTVVGVYIGFGVGVNILYFYRFFKKDSNSSNLFFILGTISFVTGYIGFATTKYLSS